MAHGASPATARKWWMGEISRLANARGVEPVELGVTPATIVELHQLIDEGGSTTSLPGRCSSITWTVRALRQRSSRTVVWRWSQTMAP
ncbi:hypothetical protein [Nesterenkonia pannonica]|uniref:hypothetical protein n=1 Tax=Nesterenkonia pannonica TaxID=1548602 RepID=UPI002164CFB8|nr:hypothetical protein [Nesterenkonia pannonica]